MKFYITGSHGFVGAALQKELAKLGHEQIGLPRDASQWPEFSGDYAVINLAGKNIFTLFTKKAKKEIYDSRITTTKNLMAHIAQLPQKPAAVVSASAVGFYGDRGDELLVESNKPGNDFLARVCVDWEKTVSDACRQQGIRFVIIRTGIVLSSGGIVKSLLPLFKLGLGGKLGNGKQYFPWISLDDLVSLYIFAAANDKLSGPINATAPELITNAQFTKTLGHILHRPVLFTVPQFAIKFLGEFGNLLLYSQKASDQQLLNAGFQFKYPTLESCLTAISTTMQRGGEI